MVSSPPERTEHGFIRPLLIEDEMRTSYMDYAMPRADDVPSYEVDRTETRCPINPLGVKGAGETGTIGSTPAVVNAAVDALWHLGVRDLQMPLTPQRVWRAINAGIGHAANGGTT